ncbi:endonuclease NucS [Methanocaldococcus sp.]
MKVHFLHKPDIKNLENFIKKHASDSIIILLSRCSVIYDGRAKSTLNEGDRVVMIKPDGSLLIHKNKKREPVNWQPPGSSIFYKVENKNFIIKSIRKKPREVLEIIAHKIYHACAFRCEDYEELNLTGSEEEMADMIFKNPKLIEEGFSPLSKEYQIPTGIIDILGKDKNNNWVILELKRRRADLQSVSQLKRYVEYFKNKYGEKRVRGILVAPSLTTGALNLLKSENLEFKKINPPKKDQTLSKKLSKKYNTINKTAILDEWL